MLFNSTVFLFLYLPIVIGVVYGVYFTSRSIPIVNLFLLTASLIFYAWGEVFYILLLLLSIAINYFLGRLLVVNGKSYKKLFLVISICLNLSILLTYKYTNFFIDNINYILSLIGIRQISLSVDHLPIGISFFTFQALSYVVDVYRRKVPPQNNLFDMALYISFFPQLIAGPIIRYVDIKEQLRERVISLQDISHGVARFVVGLGKKVLIADTLAQVVDEAFSIPTESLTATTAWIGIICFTLQIYFDFSGYSDMAIGLARMFGFKYKENFNYPYISLSIREFWRRWHISLSTWFRDYLYIPLGGNRVSQGKVYINLFIVFLLCGLWHGAAWNFIVWGLIHGLFLVIERMGFEKVLNIIWKPICYIYSLFVIMLGWVFFRADNLDHAISYLHAMFGGFNGNLQQAHVLYSYNAFTSFIIAVGVLCSLPLIPLIKNFGNIYINSAMAKNAGIVKNLYTVFGLILLFSILILSEIQLSATTHNPFIYFRF